MTRKKVKLAYITNDSARKATFKKRKKGLIKKVSELSTLCGIDACAIIYSPYESQPELWPNGSGVQRVIGAFNRMPEMEQTKKMVNQESYTRQRITKVSELLKKQLKENRELVITDLMYQCLTGKSVQSVEHGDLSDVSWVLDHKLKEIKKRYESFRKAALDQQQLVAQQSTTTTPQQMMMHHQQQQDMGFHQAMMARDLVPMNGGNSLGLDLGMARGGGFEQQQHQQQNEGPIPGLGLGMDVMQQRAPHDWLADWVNKANDQMAFGLGQGQGQGQGGGGVGQSNSGGGSGGGEDQMLLPFNNNHHNSSWHHDFFP